MIKEYLNNRKEILQNNIKLNTERYEHNQISISESNNKIKELENMVDEASEIFSVKAREDSGFNKKEIREIEIQIAAYKSENDELFEEIDNLEKELQIVQTCLKQISEYNVSRETSNFEEEKKELEIIREENLKNAGLLNKLVLCRDIAEVDGKRVAIELNNIISNMHD